MEYNDQTKTLHIRLMDAEHAGLDWSALQFEMSVYGLDESIWPDTIVIDVKTGAVQLIRPADAEGGE